MPWQNKGGWQPGGGNRGPWGRGPSGGGGGGGGMQPPNLEDLLRKGQDRFKGMMPVGNWGGRGLLLIGLVMLAVWLGSGFYRVQPDEQGVVLRFGKWVETTQPGLRYHFPSPIESVVRPSVTRVNRVDIGFRSLGDGPRGSQIRDVTEESIMLTGDENIVDIDMSVLWVIKDAGKYLFSIQQAEATVKAVAESALREQVGRSRLVPVLTEGRQLLESSTQRLMQEILDFYNAGVLVRQVTLQKIDPPAQVIDSFRDVQAARADAERQKNEAESYQNDIIPRARGESERLRQEAEAYKQEVVARSQGEAQRFISIHNEFLRAKDVTRQRIYLETMEEILRNMNKLIIDAKGVQPFLPLQDLIRRPGDRQ
ncbi:MAG: FtsH protease activity modulator HflK [Alphaproteobacteria bacterium]|nr:FtsH protease activity modulator HflK [Alphaproteobacteria bacterium]